MFLAPFSVIGAAPTHACWISIVGVLHKGVIVATVGAGATGAGVAELRWLILHAAQPVQQVIGVANGACAGAILDEIPVGVVGIVVRGGLHAGHALPALGRLVGDGEGGGVVQGVVDAGRLLHERERPAVGAALLLRVNRAAQRVGGLRAGVAHVAITALLATLSPAMKLS